MVTSMSASQLMVPDFVSGTMKSAGADLFTGTADDGSVDVVYHRGVFVKFGGKIYEARRDMSPARHRRRIGLT
jgi:hypothetical protein